MDREGIELEGRVSKRRIRQITDRLTELGLSDDEASVYVNLYALGLSKVRSISEAAGLERSKTYRVLDRLEDQGLVRETLENPARYEAIDADRVIDEKIGEQQDRIQRLEDLRGEIVPAMQRLADGSEPVAAGSPGFRTVQGREAIYRNWSRMVENAEDELLGLSTHPNAMQLARIVGVEAMVEELCERGVTTRLLVGAAEDEAEALRPPGADTFNLRTVSTEKTIRFALQDRKKLLLAVQSDPSQRLKSDDDVALVTDAPGLIEGYTTLFEQWWERADGV